MEQQWKGRFFAVECDLSSKSSIEKASKNILDRCEALHGLVNNAGIFLPGSIESDSDENWESHFAVNLLGPVRLTRALWPLLKRNQSSAIVNISSTLGIRPIPGTGSYSAFKAAMNNWTASLALEGAPHGIRANSLCPGIVDTPIHSFHQSKDPTEVERKNFSQKLQPLGRIGKPQDMAPLVAHLISEDSAWTTGSVIPVDGGILLNS